MPHAIILPHGTPRDAEGQPLCLVCEPERPATHILTYRHIADASYSRVALCERCGTRLLHELTATPQQQVQTSASLELIGVPA